MHKYALRLRNRILHIMANTVGFTHTKKYMCLEDLEQLYDLKVASPLHLSYCGREKCDPGASFGPYIRNNFVIHIVTEGKGIYKIGNREFLVGAGEMFAIYPGDTTYYEADHDDPWSYMWIGFNGLRAKTAVEAIGFTKEKPVLDAGDLSRIRDSIDRMLIARQLNHIDAMRRMSALYETLAIMMELNENENTHAQNNNVKYVNMAIDCIATGYSENIKISEIASKVGINRSYLTSIFKQQLNMSPQEYLINFRIEIASELLRTTTEPIGSIAVAVGYSDPLTFSKAFRKKTNMTPTEYRKMSVELRQESVKGGYTGSFSL